LLKVYHAYSLLLMAWLATVFITLLLPTNVFSSVLDNTLYAGRAFVDNWMIAIALLSAQSFPLKSVAVAAVVTALKIGAMFTFYFEPECGFCPLFFPAPQSLYVELGFAIIYSGLFAASYKRSLIPRTTSSYPLSSSFPLSFSFSS